MVDYKENQLQLPKDLKNNICKYIEDNQPQIFWDYCDKLDKNSILEVLDSPDPEGAFLDMEANIWNLNIEHICNLECELIKEVLATFKEDFINLQIDYTNKQEFEEFFFDTFQNYIMVDLNIKKLINNTPDLNCCIVIHSNYDCTTSDQKIDQEGDYLCEVYKRVKNACKKEDYIMEYANSYTACLLMFRFKTDFENLIQLKKDFKNFIEIPKGTEYGFFSSFQGCGSMFTSKTIKKITLPKQETAKDMNPKYDYVRIVADMQQAYSMEEVYGKMDFDEQNIIVG